MTALVASSSHNKSYASDDVTSRFIYDVTRIVYVTACISSTHSISFDVYMTDAPLATLSSSTTLHQGVDLGSAARVFIEYP